MVLSNNARFIRGIGINPQSHNQLPNESHNLEVLPNNLHNQPNQLCNGKILEADRKKQICTERKSESPPPEKIKTDYVETTGYVDDTQTQSQRETQPHNQLNEGGYDNEQTGYVTPSSTSSPAVTTSIAQSLNIGDKVRTTRYPREVATILSVNGNNIRIEHPYGYEWVLKSEIIEVES